MGLRLNLGCGTIKREGWTGVDSLKSVNPDVLHDLTQAPWPFESDSAERIEGVDFLEHIDWEHGRDYLIVVMNECHRILRSDGVAFFRSPDAELWPYGQQRDPTHRRPINCGSCDYWNGAHYTYRHVGESYGFKPWKILKNEAFRPGNGAVFRDIEQTPVK